MTRRDELRELLKLHHQARGMLLDLDGPFAEEIREKDRMIEKIKIELDTVSQGE